MKHVDRSRLVHYLARAEAFAAGMKFLADDCGTYGPAVALLAVHSAISFADAILVGLQGQRSNEEDHRASPRRLFTLCRSLRRDDAGIRQFQWLIERKSIFAYEDRPVGINDVKSAVTAAERFQAWTYRTFQELRDEDKPAS